VLSEGKVTNYELTARARDGALTVVSYNASTFHDRDRNLQGVIAARATSRAEALRAEHGAEERRAGGRQPHAVGVSGQHVARTAHPLVAIIGFSEVLRDGLLGELTLQQRATSATSSAAQHLLALINDILDLSKVEAGKMVLDVEQIQVPVLLQNSLSIVKEKARRAVFRMDLVAASDMGRSTGRTQGQADSL